MISLDGCDKIMLYYVAYPSEDAAKTNILSGENTMNFNFICDTQKCTGCGLCTKVCGTSILHVVDGVAVMEPVTEPGWEGCFRCQHCLAVCPQGAISILGKNPEDSLLPPSQDMGAMLDALMVNRRACRRFKDENVDKETIRQMLKIVENVPNGSNKQLMEFTLIDDKEECRKFRAAAHRAMEQLAKEGIYPGKFSRREYELMEKWEILRNPGDMLFCNAPHLLMIHSPMNQGCWQVDPVIASTYFELLCASRNIGCIFMTFPLAALSKMPEIRALLQIPEDHYLACVMGFGYPEIEYHRGVQREGIAKIHRLTFPDL